MRIAAVSLASVLALSACQTTEAVMAGKQDSLNTAYVGRPLSDFIFANGLNPEDAFDMPGGERVFVFPEPCRSWWRTQRQGEGGTPAHYIVKAIEVRGYCA